MELYGYILLAIVAIGLIVSAMDIRPKTDK